jgi:hypothetical protein
MIWRIFLDNILVPYIVKNFSDYNCNQLNIHLDSRLNIQELYCYEFYEIRSVFEAFVYSLKSPNRFQSIKIPCLQILATQ